MSVFNNQTFAPAPPLEPSQDEKAYAGLAHALMISTWWVGPLIILLIKREFRFVKFHAAQALIWEVIFSLLYMGGFLVLFGSMMSAALLSAGHDGKPPNPQQAFPIISVILFLVFWASTMACMVLTFVLGIMFCLKAMRGEWKGYPLIGEWAKKIAGV